MNAEDKNKASVKLLGVDHIALNVTDLDRTQRFYSEVLGFRVTSRGGAQGKNRHIEMEAGSVCLALFETPDLELGSAHEIMTRQGYFHLAFEVEQDHINSVVDILKDHDVALDGKPRNHGGGPSVYFFDPDGYHIELHANT